MTRVIADEVLRAKFANFSRPVEVCDESGRVIARLFPTAVPSELEATEPPISKEELLRRKQSKGKTYSTTEVLVHLEKL